MHTGMRAHERALIMYIRMHSSTYAFQTNQAHTYCNKSGVKEEDDPEKEEKQSEGYQSNTDLLVLI
jgi:hypothetical protein